MAEISKKELNQKALKAGILFTICQFFVRGLSFLVTPFYTRVMTPEQYGTVVIFQSWLAIMVPIISLGLFRSIEVAKHDYHEKYNNYVRNTVILIGILCSAFAICSIIFHQYFVLIFDMTEWMLGFMVFYLFAESAIMCFNRREKQLMRSKWITMFTTIYVIVSTISSVGLLLYGYINGQTERLLFYRIAGFYVPYIIFGFMIAGFLIVQGKSQKMMPDWKYGVTFSVPLIAELLSIQVMNQIDKIMISRMCGKTEAGIYSLATTISYILWIVEDSVWSAWQPWLYEKISRKEEKDIQHYWDQMMYAFGVISILTVLVTPELIAVLGGKEYVAAIYIVMPLTLSTLYRFYSYSFSALENYYKKTKYVAIATVVVMFINVIFNFIGIQFFGYVAAAYATALSYFIMIIVQGMFERKVTGKMILSISRTLVISGITFIICLAMMQFYHVHFLIRYVVILAIIVVYGWTNRSLVTGILRKFIKKK